MGDILINMIVYTSSGIINYSFWADTGVCPYKTAFPLNPQTYGALPVVIRLHSRHWVGNAIQDRLYER